MPRFRKWWKGGGFKTGMARAVQRKKHGEMNRTEQEHATNLDFRDDVLWWAYEAITLKLADDTRYTPDFVVMLDDGTIEFHETKALMANGKPLFQDDARVKLKVAAKLFPMFRFRCFAGRKPSKKHGGDWQWKEECFGWESEQGNADRESDAGRGGEGSGDARLDRGEQSPEG